MRNHVKKKKNKIKNRKNEKIWESVKLYVINLKLYVRKINNKLQVISYN